MDFTEENVEESLFEADVETQIAKSGNQQIFLVTGKGHERPTSCESRDYEG